MITVLVSWFKFYLNFSFSFQPYADPYSLDQLTPREHVDHYLNTSGHYNAHVNPYKALPPIPQDVSYSPTYNVLNCRKNSPVSICSELSGFEAPGHHKKASIGAWLPEAFTFTRPFVIGALFRRDFFIPCLVH
jgi:hypothetical protein